MPLGCFDLKRPARPPICLSSDEVTLTTLLPSNFSVVVNITRPMLRFRPIPTASVATSMPASASLKTFAWLRRDSGGSAPYKMHALRSSLSILRFRSYSFCLENAITQSPSRRLSRDAHERAAAIGDRRSYLSTRRRSPRSSESQILRMRSSERGSPQRCSS